MRVHTVLMLIITTIMAGCGNEKKTMLSKSWQVSDVQFINAADSTVLGDTLQGNLQASREAILRDVMIKNIYQFKSDGTYRTGNAAASSEGDWELSGNNIRFFLKTQDETKEKLVPIEKLTPDTLIVLLKQDQTTLQMKLILTPLPE